MGKGPALEAGKAWLREVATELGHGNRVLYFTDDDADRLIYAFAKDRTRALEDFGARFSAKPGTLQPVCVVGSSRCCA